MSTEPEPSITSEVGSLVKLDRRAFICVALGLVTASQSTRAAASSSSATAPANVGNKANLGIRAGTLPGINPGSLLTTLSDPSAASWLGQHYIAEHPDDQDVNRLVDKLVAALNARQGQLPTDSLALRQALIDLIQREYIDAPLRSVGGWLLAPSEARLYALAALSGNSQQAQIPAPSLAHLPAPRPMAGC